MKSRETIATLLQSSTERTVTVKGWVRTFRANRFIALNDGSTINNIQCVVDFENTDEAILKRITTGAAVSVTGTLQESQGRGQSVEIQVSEIEILGDSNPEEYPIQPKKHSFEFLRENAHLRIRTNTFGAVMRVRSALAFAVHEYFVKNGFYYFHSPIITGSDAEGAGEMFSVTTLDINNTKKKDKNSINYSKFEKISKKYFNLIIEKLNLSYHYQNIEFEKIICSPKNFSNSDLDKFITNDYYELNEIITNNYDLNELITSYELNKIHNKVKEICAKNSWNLRFYKNKKISKIQDLNFFKRFGITSPKVIDYKDDFFGKHTNLTVSGQLEGETYAMGLGKIYTFGPTFRAENSNTTRHLAEFWMIEPEVAFNDLEDNIDLAEDFIKYVIKYVLENCKDDLNFLSNRLTDEEKSKPANQRSEMTLLERLDFVVNNDFKRVSYTEAIDILRNSKPNKKKKFQYIIDEWGADLQSEHERYLVEKHFKSPVVLFDYPANIKAFYMRLNEDEKTVRAMDVLFPGIGEIVGGSQREERLDVLKDKMKKLDIDEKELWWYLDTRRFGTAVHSGFGLGFERLVQFATGMGNIRDVIPYPRTPQNAEF